jgi:formylglycine-generating enzyme required for sulfatase activity
MADASSPQKLKVFVSYSRRDSSDFAEELVAGLELAGFAPFLDRHDIAAGEDWEARLGGLIQGADTVVFVVSPEAVKSERCVWEVDRALAQTKRLLPVIFRPVSESDIPEQLRRRQFVRFDTGPGITRQLGQLAEALRQDIDWIREHTRQGELAGRWEARGRPESLLLRGEDLAAAQSWAAKRNPSAPNVTDLMRAFIAASKDAEAAEFAKSRATQRRIIRTQALLSTVLLGVIIGLVGWINESYIKKQWDWYAVTRPYMRSHVRPYLLTEAKERALKPGDSFKECAQDCPEMIVVPAGSFAMGSPATEQGHTDKEEPKHNVTIAKPLAVSKYELTFADWDACVTGGGCNGYKPNDERWKRGQQPLINVSWDDAQQYVSWLSEVTDKNYRLLSEAEYEYAMRAGTQMTYPWGDDIEPNGTAMANCNGCGSKWDNKQTAPVGSFAPNRFGLYDMAGNVWAWVEDCDHDNYNGAPADGSAWTEGANCDDHIARGGSWYSYPVFLRSARRLRNSTGNRDDNIGFRVARTLAP